MTLIEAVQSFHSATMAKPLSSAAASMYFAIIRVWNSARRPASITMSSAELRRLSGIRCYDTYHDALQTLLRLRLIKKIHPCTGLTLHLAVNNPLEIQQKSQPLKSKSLLNIPKTETEGAREAESVAEKLENRTTGKYAGMTLAQMIEARRVERESLTKGATANDGEHTGGNRSREEIAIGTAAKGRERDTGSSDADNGGGFLSAGTQADIQSDVEAVE